MVTAVRTRNGGLETGPSVSVADLLARDAPWAGTPDAIEVKLDQRGRPAVRTGGPLRRFVKAACGPKWWFVTASGALLVVGLLANMALVTVAPEVGTSASETRNGGVPDRAASRRPAATGQPGADRAGATEQPGVNPPGIAEQPGADRSAAPPAPGDRRLPLPNVGSPPSIRAAAPAAPVSPPAALSGRAPKRAAPRAADTTGSRSTPSDRGTSSGSRRVERTEPAREPAQDVRESRPGTTSKPDHDADKPAERPAARSDDSKRDTQRDEDTSRPKRDDSSRGVLGGLLGQ